MVLTNKWGAYIAATKLIWTAVILNGNDASGPFTNLIKCIARRCTRKMLSASWGKSEQAAPCGGYYHGTQTTDSNRVCDCLLSVRADIITTHAWTKQIMS